MYGLKPRYVRIARTRSRNGKSRVAPFASARNAGSDNDRSKPTRSRVAPIRTGPAAVPSTTGEVCRAAESLATSAT